jgi:S-adenosyl-L-methionine hydrolase (adenosine-forming)
MPLITLLTDFGLADTYVGQMKGAILTAAPDAQLVDLTHTVSPQDVFGGAFLLWTAVETFSTGTVHLAVVDPGVGSARRAIAVLSARGDAFVGPDNGLLMPAVERLGGLSAAVELSDHHFWRPTLSTTFHGRDIFGPVASHLANGVPLEALGPMLNDVVRLSLPKPDGLRGEVLHVDTYGNLVTNLSADALPARYVVHIGSRVVRPARNYTAVAPGGLLALVGSAGLLEISARDASAAALLNAQRGTRVRVEATSG